MLLRRWRRRSAAIGYAKRIFDLEMDRRRFGPPRRVPDFVRPMVRIAVERVARAEGASEVTEAHVAAAGEAMGHGPS